MALSTLNDGNGGGKSVSGFVLQHKPQNAIKATVLTWWLICQLYGNMHPENHVHTTILHLFPDPSEDVNCAFIYCTFNSLNNNLNKQKATFFKKASYKGNKNSTPIHKNIMVM